MRKTQKIVSSMLNAQSRLSTVGAFQLIQDAVTEHMGSLKIDGFTIKEKYDAFWVFVKTKVRFVKDVAWNGKLTISAFISKITLASLSIDVEARDEVGDMVMCSRTELCALDRGSGRIKKVSAVGVTDEMLSRRKAEDITFEKADFNSLPKVCDVEVRYTNIDFCRHTNNLEYIRLIMNTYSVADMDSRKLTEVEINYISQSHEHDILSICKQTVEGKDLFVIENNSRPIVKCKIGFKEV